MASAGPWTNGTRVLVVFDQGGIFARRDLRVYGAAEYQFTNGRSERLRWNSAKQIVLDDTASPFTVAKVRYGVTWAEPDETRVGRYEVAKFDGRIDHFGPNDLPPQTSEKWERYWLR